MLPLLDFIHNVSPAIFAGLLICAAISDIRSYTISNALCVLVALSYCLYAFTGPSEASAAVGVAGAVLIVGTGLFAANVMGGGDVKLIAAAALWAGPHYIFPFLLITALAGGMLSLAVMLRPRLYQLAGRTVDTSNLDVPYGVAIAAGGIMVASHLIAL